MKLKRMIDELNVGEQLKLYYGEMEQATISCVQCCGYKWYLVLANMHEDNLFFEGNSKEERNKCLKDICLWVDRFDFGQISMVYKTRG